MKGRLTEMSYFYDLKEINRKKLAPGVTTKLIWGDKIMISVIEMEPFPYP